MKILSPTGEILGYKISQRARLLHRPKHPNADKYGNIKESRLQAATALGHPLPKNVIVHHYNDTLIICQDSGYHRLLHARQEAYETCGDANKRRCVICKQYDDLNNLTISLVIEQNTSRYWHKSCQASYVKAQRHKQK